MYYLQENFVHTYNQLLQVILNNFIMMKNNVTINLGSLFLSFTHFMHDIMIDQQLLALDFCNNLKQTK